MFDCMRVGLRPPVLRIHLNSVAVSTLRWLNGASQPLRNRLTLCQHQVCFQSTGGRREERARGVKSEKGGGGERQGAAEVVKKDGEEEEEECSRGVVMGGEQQRR